jgi:hypothetical protein
MMNPTETLIESLGDHLDRCYKRVYGPINPEYPQVLNTAARMALEHIANSDALYHDVMHTIQVARVGQEILRGRHLMRRVTPEDWLHFTVATLFHDIGYVRGVCSDDERNAFVINDQCDKVVLPRGATDAFLTPYHVNRSKLFVLERGANVPYLDAQRLAAAIELTRFPVPDSEDHQQTDTEAGLVRAADLIGQLADPHYLRKTTHLFLEFKETGLAESLGYETAADLADAYPTFFWNVARPYLEDALSYLRLTQEGKQWVANLHSHIFAVEHSDYRLGPSPG